jgi:hypothetical protein
MGLVNPQTPNTLVCELCGSKSASPSTAAMMPLFKELTLPTRWACVLSVGLGHHAEDSPGNVTRRIKDKASECCSVNSDGSR